MAVVVIYLHICTSTTTSQPSRMSTVKTSLPPSAIRKRTISLSSMCLEVYSLLLHCSSIGLQCLYDQLHGPHVRSTLYNCLQHLFLNHVYLPLRSWWSLAITATRQKLSMTGSPKPTRWRITTVPSTPTLRYSLFFSLYCTRSMIVVVEVSTSKSIVVWWPPSPSLSSVLFPERHSMSRSSLRPHLPHLLPLWALHFHNHLDWYVFCVSPHDH